MRTARMAGLVRVGQAGHRGHVLATEGDCRGALRGATTRSAAHVVHEACMLDSGKAGVPHAAWQEQGLIALRHRVTIGPGCLWWTGYEPKQFSASCLPIAGPLLPQPKKKAAPIAGGRLKTLVVMGGIEPPTYGL